MGSSALPIETQRLRLRPLEPGDLDEFVALHAEPEVTAVTNAENDRSIRVAERLGLTPLREDRLLGDPVVAYGVQRAGNGAPQTAS